MSDIIHNIADMLDQRGDSPLNTKDTSQDFIHGVEFDSDDNMDQCDDAMFIPPLQQKLELLKKIAGVESEYDDSEDSEDELGDIQKLSGIHPIAVHIASDDNDIVG